MTTTCFSFALDTDGLRQINKGRRKENKACEVLSGKKSTEERKGELRDAGACERINKHTGRMGERGGNTSSMLKG